MLKWEYTAPLYIDLSQGLEEIVTTRNGNVGFMDMSVQMPQTTSNSTSSNTTTSKSNTNKTTISSDFEVLPTLVFLPIISVIMMRKKNKSRRK